MAGIGFDTTGPLSLNESPFSLVAAPRVDQRGAILAPTETSMSRPPGDRVLRAISDDGAFRVITVETTCTARGAVEAQRVHGPHLGIFADLITGAVLVRETMSPDLRVQAILQAEDHKSRMIADAHPDATT